MADRLIIHGLSAQCRIGTDEWEQLRPQSIEIDLAILIDAASAARRDELKDAVDYAALVQAVKTTAEEKPYRLMETLAEAIASCVLSASQTPTVTVAVRKRSFPGIEHAAVHIERSRQGRL